MTYYIKGGSRYDEANPKVWVALMLGGFPYADYLLDDWKNLDDKGHETAQDPFWRLGGSAGGAKEAEIGLWDDYRIKFETTGITYWDGDSWEDLLGGGGSHKLNEILNPDADKTFTFVNNSLKFSFTAPTHPTFDGAFEIEAIGIFTGDLIHIHQHTGNVGATNLVHIEATDADCVVLSLKHGANTGTFGVNGLQLNAGATITEFDTTALANSDTKVPTNTTVIEYVATQVHTQNHDNTYHSTNYEVYNANIQSHVASPGTSAHHVKTVKYTDAEAVLALYQGDIGSGVDLNVYKDEDYNGYWQQKSNAYAAAGSNYPVSLAGSLLTWTCSDGSFCTQTYTVYNSSKDRYVRTYYSSWNAWQKLTYTDELHAEVHAHGNIGSDGKLNGAWDNDGNYFSDNGGTLFRTSVAAVIALKGYNSGTPTYQGISMETTCANGTDYTSCMYSDTTNNRVSQCDADFASQMPCIGLRVSSSRILLMGVVRNDSVYNFTPNGAVLYVGTNGLITTSIPGGVGDTVQVVGVVMEPDVIYFRPSLSYVVRQ